MISHITSSIASAPASRRYSSGGICASRSGSRVKTVEKRRVELLIDESGARALDLVRHAARAEDDDA